MKSCLPWLASGLLVQPLTASRLAQQGGEDMRSMTGNNNGAYRARIEQVRRVRPVRMVGEPSELRVDRPVCNPALLTTTK